MASFRMCQNSHSHNKVIVLQKLGGGEECGGFLNSVLVMQITMASNHKPKKEESDIVTVVIKKNSITSLHFQIDAMLSQI